MRRLRQPNASNRLGPRPIVGAPNVLRPHLPFLMDASATEPRVDSLIQPRDTGRFPRVSSTRIRHRSPAAREYGGHPFVHVTVPPPGSASHSRRPGLEE